LIIVFPALFHFLVKPKAIAIALWPFIIVQNVSYKYDARLINHERIHLRQQVELLILPFYILYVGEWLYYLIKTRDRLKAYYAISFEQEAFANENTYSYLLQRPWWNFRKFYKQDLFGVKGDN